MKESRHIGVIGVFKGMGDLLAAVPVMLEELRSGSELHVLLFPGDVLKEFAQLLDFSGYTDRLFFHVLPPIRPEFSQWRVFLRTMKRLDPDFVWISAHAPAKDSSWKIPLLLRLLQLLFWRHSVLVGAESERLSFLFGRRLPLDRNLPLREREWSAYCLFKGYGQERQPPQARFLQEITAAGKVSPHYDLVIHPGANALNRRWPYEKYRDLLPLLPEEWRIGVLGLPGDIAEMKRVLPPESRIDYISGTIRDSIRTLASARMLLVMDSGNMHFAQLLGIPAVVVFGYTDPYKVISRDGCLDIVYDPHLPCQPCMKSTCSQPEIFCLIDVEAHTVAERLKKRWESLSASTVAEGI